MPDKSEARLQHAQKEWWGHQPHNRINTPTTQKHNAGSDLLSHNPPVAVPSAQKGLTSRFGKDTGCNPLAKTTNKTKTSNNPTKRRGDHSQASEHNYSQQQPNQQIPRGCQAVLAVNRTVDANTIKHTPTKKEGQSLLVIGQLVLVSWSPYNVYTPSLSTR